MEQGAKSTIAVGTSETERDLSPTVALLGLCKWGLGSAKESAATQPPGLWGSMTRELMLRLLALAEINGVYWLALQGLCCLLTSGELLEECRARLDEQATKFTRAVEVAEWLEHTASKAGIRLFTMKSFLNFPYVDADIDVVLVDNEWDWARTVVNDAGFTLQHNLAELREPFKRLFAHPGDPTLPFIHLHRYLSWNGIIALAVEQVWQRSSQQPVTRQGTDGPELVRLSPEDELLITMGHIVFENYCVRLNDVLHLGLFNTDNWDWAYVASTAGARNWRAGLSLASRAWNQLKAMWSPGQALPVDTNHPALAHPNLLPHYLDYSVLLRSVYLPKLKMDLRGGRLSTIPRQLFSYTLVGYYWKYSRARRKAEATHAGCRGLLSELSA